MRARDLAEAKRLPLEQNLDPLVVLSDMNLRDGNAFDLLESVRREARGGEWILLTGCGTVPDSVRAMRLGAYDFLEKPCATERLDLVVQGAQRKLAAAPPSAMVIGGETGSGKGLAARILHYSGPRGDGALVEVNCASLPRALLESEIFGHEAGAFTGAKGRHRGLIEQAQGGNALPRRDR